MLPAGNPPTEVCLRCWSDYQDSEGLCRSCGIPLVDAGQVRCSICTSYPDCQYGIHELQFARSSQPPGGSVYFCKRCGAIIWITPPNVEAPKRKVVSGPYAELGVQPGCGLEAAQKAYRLAARKAHPDTGGSHEAAVRVNRAWAAVRAQEGAGR